MLNLERKHHPAMATTTFGGHNPRPAGIVAPIIRPVAAPKMDTEANAMTLQSLRSALDAAAALRSALAAIHTHPAHEKDAEAIIARLEDCAERIFYGLSSLLHDQEKARLSAPPKP